VNFVIHRLLFPAMMTQFFGGTSEPGVWWHHTNIRVFVMFTNKRYVDAILNIQQLLAHQREY
jgi:hypothetical protein